MNYYANEMHLNVMQIRLKSENMYIYCFLFPFLMLCIAKMFINGWQLAKMKKSIPDMSLP